LTSGLGGDHSPAFGERLIVCAIANLAAERARKREALLVATERELARIRAQVRRRGLSCARRPRSVWPFGEVVNAEEMAKALHST